MAANSGGQRDVAVIDLTGDSEDSGDESREVLGNVTVGGISLLEQDLHTLQENQWINDKVYD